MIPVLASMIVQIVEVSEPKVISADLEPAPSVTERTIVMAVTLRIWLVRKSVGADKRDSQNAQAEDQHKSHLILKAQVQVPDELSWQSKNDEV